MVPLAAAVCAALVQYAPAALAGPDACSGSSVRTCQGNQSAGVSFTSGVSTLNVLNLTSNITPAAGATGLRLSSSGSDGGNGGSFPVVGGAGDRGDNGTGLTIRVTADGRLILTNNLVIGPFDFSAYGILGFSSGGDGGNGGNGTALVVTPGLGGDGGAGGNGGSVSITSDIAIITNGASAHGVYGLSRAGNGGDGGNGNGIGLILAQGGDGGSGGSGGAVSINSSGAITTHGASAQGIFARSLGGISGDGGSGTLSVVGKGGAAAGSGPGGNVAVTSSGTVVTGGADARGIFAQSVGGFAAQAGAGGGIVGFGGSGESSGDGGTVRIINHGAITTGGVRADAIFAESVGGGGGSAGGSGGLFALGGSGSAGGNGDTVTVINSNALVTSGERSRGIFAQSLGGGGGDGGASGGLLTFGGSGSSTGSGGTVNVTNDGAITTGGRAAQAIFAQSLGGGGGDGGVGVGLITFGGSGGAGGNAMPVNVGNTGALATSGADAAGILAQSMGGGGGNAGGAVAVSAFLGFSLGGAGGPGSSSQKVHVDTQTGTIDTTGDRSHGILAQSVGGGGGNGGFAVALSAGVGGSVSVAVGGRAGGGGAGGEVEVDSASAITTHGEDAHALFAQSVGGGGGNGGFSIAGAGTDGVGIAIGYGGTGGSGGVGKRVDVLSDGTLETFGARSYGLLAQSLGGGGGNGGFKITGAGGGLGAGSLSLGGNGSGGGNADQVMVTTNGAITTHGEDAYGLLAQSVGGGGGNGSFAIAAAGAGTGAGTLGVGGFAGGGGDGRRVDVFSHGTIDTFGVRSTGLLAQSIGGGGGNGGFSITGAGAGTGAGTFNLGGRGGLGGDGNIVYVERTGAITTRGAEAHGLLAQSVGGGGGNGGFSIAGSGAGTGAGTIAIGGFSLGGGDGMAVTVASGGATETFGSNAVGVLAQSVGGGGGNGAFSIAGAGAGTGSGTFNLGGGGGLGGDGSTVDVTSTGAIITHGAESYGLLAQSLGGGGGNGGFNVSGSGAGTGTGTVGVGGTGDHGGDASTVTIDNRGNVATYGATAHGIFAQSLGGGGGNGGFSISGSGAGTGSGVVSVGGSGQGGGIGGAVDVTNSGSIAVLGSGGNGILAQSLGGGGGNGGFSFAGSFGRRDSRSLTVSVGGSAGGGGSAGSVTVLNRGAIDIAAASAAENSLMPAHGIYAQSIGGGGGNGGLSTALGSLSLGAVFNVSVSVGGSGGAGREGGTVDITNEGVITTRDHDSHGVYAQSIGGGGGQGGSSLNFNLDGGSTSGDKTFSSSITVGGNGGSGNIGGEVIANNRGSIHTGGDSSHGIYAQSIGGGGGDGGNAKAVSLSASDLTPWKDSDGQDWRFNLNIGGSGGNGNKGGKVTITNSGDIQTEGVLARGIFAQSIGGGGGSVSDGVLGEVGDFVDNAGDVLDAVNLAFAIGKAVKKRNPSNLLPTGVSLTVGGNGGNQGDADEVRVVNDGDITTAGMEAHAIFAQSIGGGGGEAQLYAKGVGAGESASVGIGTTLQPVIGGAGGAAGDGGAVKVTHNGTITTWGEAANGISAQSIGGGGGQAGSIAGGFSDWRSIGLGLAFGRSGGSGGDGGNVEVTSTGTIATHANNAIGIFAQSVGGGGGIIGDVGGIAFAGSVGGNGSAGTVNVTHAGNITTAGNVAHGIFAQSAGGQGMGRAVGVTLNGTVTAGGGDSTGIFAQSRGDQGAGDITVDILSGGVEGGSGSGAGVAMLEGRNNRLTNHGTITTRPGFAGTAIAASTGNETVINFGTVTGNVDLGAGTNAFDNNTGATFNSGAQAVLGAGNTLTNAGTLSPGGSRNAANTALSGNLRQTNGGMLALDLDHARQTTDRVEATGTADLAGKARVQNVNAGRVRSGVNTYTILTSAGGVTDSGFGLDTRQAAVIGYQLLFPNANDILLQTSVNFSPSQGLNPNQRAIGANINSIQSTGGSASFAPVTAALFELPDTQALGPAYDRLSAEGYLATGTGTLFANEGFSNALLSCRVRDGEYRFVREGNCGWMRFSKGSIRQDQTTANFGFDEDAIQLAGGFQRAIDSTWHVGLGLAYQDSDTDVSNLSRTNGQQVQIGGVVKGRTGATTYSATVTAGKGWYDTDRFVNIPTLGVVAASNQDVGLFGGRFRLAHAWEPGKNWYVRPMIDAAVTYARFDGFDEVGAGGANLEVASRNETWVSVQPAVEVGGELELADRTLVRPNLKLGITQYVSGTDPSITASFAGAPAGVAPFTVSGEFDRTYLDVDAGVDVLAVNGAVLRIGYAGRFSSHVTANAATLKVSIPF